MMIEHTLLNRDYSIHDHLEINEFINLARQDRDNIYNHITRDIGMPRIHAKLVLTKAINLLMAKYHFLHKNRTLISRPFGLIVDPTNNCNLRCVGCIHTSPLKDNISWPKGHLKSELLNSFLKVFGPAATHIYFYNGGEPLLNSRISDFIKLARKYGLFTVVSTNMNVSNSFDFDALVNSGLDYLIVAIDGCSENTYRKYRINGSFERATQNLQKLIAAKKKNNRYAPYTVWQFLTFDHNIHEIDTVKQMAQQIGVNELVIAEPSWGSEWDEEIKYSGQAKPERITFHYDFEKAVENIDGAMLALEDDTISENYDRMFESMSETPSPAYSKTEDPTCAWLYKNIIMDATGRIIPCCRPPFKTNDLVFGNFQSTGDFQSAYNSPKYRLMRRFFADRHSVCNCIELLKDTSLPFCCICQDSKTSIVDTNNVENYLKTTSLFSVLPAEVTHNLTHW